MFKYFLLLLLILVVLFLFWPDFVFFHGLFQDLP